MAATVSLPLRPLTGRQTPTNEDASADVVIEIPGGEPVIFRKDNRGESFQRQISGLRKQFQPEDEQDSEEFRYDRPQDTSQFTTPAIAPDEDFQAREAVEENQPPRPQAQPAVTASTSQTYRPSWQSADASTSVIAANAHWNGMLHSEGSFHVHGRADGELHAGADVFVAEGAEIDAKIFAENVVVAGTVRGTIDARSRLEVLPQGHVAGDVRAPKLVVQEGARLSGQLKMESGPGATYSSDEASAAPRRRRGGQ